MFIERQRFPKEGEEFLAAAAPQGYEEGFISAIENSIRDYVQKDGEAIALWAVLANAAQKEQSSQQMDQLLGNTANKAPKEVYQEPKDAVSSAVVGSLVGILGNSQRVSSSLRLWDLVIEKAINSLVSIGLRQPTALAPSGKDKVPSYIPTEEYIKDWPRPKFLNYDPKPLKFGTSGLRDFDEYITDFEVYINTLGFLEAMALGSFYLPSWQRGKILEEGKRVVLLGRDLRPSSDNISEAIAFAIEESGYELKYAGKVTTSELSYYAFQHGWLSIMVTGSHIPFGQNGIKYNLPRREILKIEEKEMLGFVEAVRRREYYDEKRIEKNGRLFNPDGSFRQGRGIGAVSMQRKVEEFYLKRYVDIFQGKPLRGKLIVVYEHSSVGRDLLIEELKGLGAQVIGVGRAAEGTFVAIDTENVTKGQQIYFRQLARYFKGSLFARIKRILGIYNPLFAIVSGDGDCDRPFVMDEEGLFYRGDILNILAAQYLKADAVATPNSANKAVGWAMEEMGTIYKRTQIGSPHIALAFLRFLEYGYKRIVGWEVNGGLLVGSDMEVNGKILHELPTRDSFLPILCALMSAQEENKPLSEVFRQKVKAYYTQASLIKNFASERAKQIIGQISPKGNDKNKIHEVYFGDGAEVRVIRCPYEGTLEGSFEEWLYGIEEVLGFDFELGKELTGIREKLQTFFIKEYGFTDIVAMTFRDGIEIIFGN